MTALYESVEQELVSLVDETSWKEGGSKPWLWVKATKQATVFRILPGRSRQDAETIIGRNENGIVTSEPVSGIQPFGAAASANLLDALETGFSSLCRTDG